MVPKLSIIVPVYNIGNFIEKCIKSILAQTIKDFELILIDDGSTDNSPQLCDEYSTLDDRIKVIHQENAGVSAARNAGLKLAQGEFVGFVDGDDYIESSMYESIIKEMENSGVDIGICGYNLVYENNIKTLSRRYFGEEGKKTILSQDDTLKESIRIPPSITSCIWNKVFRKKIISEVYFSTDMSVGEDTAFFLKVALKANKSIYISSSYYNYLQRDGSAMNSDPANRIELFNLADLICNEVNKFKPHIMDFALHRYVDVGFSILNLAQQTQDKRFDSVINQIKKGFHLKIMSILKSKLIKSNQKILVLMVLIHPHLYHKALMLKNR